MPTSNPGRAKTKTADAVVIGAGINGAATAYNLVRCGLPRVMLLDRHLIASGGTGRSAAIIRQHYSNEELVRMVKRSVEIFADFNGVVGGDPAFVNSGWSFLVPEDGAAGLARNLELAHRVGVDVRRISKEELRELEPRIDLSDVSHIAYEPGSGYADPIAATCAYVRRFVELGGQLLPMTAARGLVMGPSGVKAVKIDAGQIATNVVVNAAGPWARRVGAWAGVDVPIRVTCEAEVLVETAHAGGPPRLAFSDMAKAIYYRPFGQTRILVGRGFPKEYEYVDPDACGQEVSAAFIDELAKRFGARWPCFSDSLFVNAFTGLYDVTPDWHPILGKVQAVDGFYMCAGFSGHGFKIAPAVGELMAELILEGKTQTVDLGRFDLARFEAGGELFTAAYGGNRA